MIRKLADVAGIGISTRHQPSGGRTDIHATPNLHGNPDETTLAGIDTILQYHTDRTTIQRQARRRIGPEAVSQPVEMVFGNDMCTTTVGLHSPALVQLGSMGECLVQDGHRSGRLFAEHVQAILLIEQQSLADLVKTGAWTVHGPYPPLAIYRKFRQEIVLGLARIVQCPI
ncbi:MAG: hypothetical protein WDA70_04665 [Lysobacteraceae bacterium]